MVLLLDGVCNGRCAIRLYAVFLVILELAGHVKRSRADESDAGNLRPRIRAAE